MVDEAPLRLALEAREGMGGEEIEMPLQLAFEAREGMRVVDNTTT